MVNKEIISYCEHCNKTIYSDDENHICKPIDKIIDKILKEKLD